MMILAPFGLVLWMGVSSSFVATFNSLLCFGSSVLWEAGEWVLARLEFLLHLLDSLAEGNEIFVFRQAVLLLIAVTAESYQIALTIQIFLRVHHLKHESVIKGIQIRLLLYIFLVED